MTGRRDDDRTESTTDVQTTARVERVEPEPPAKLPPPPATAEGWFDQVPTHPGAPRAPAVVAPGPTPITSTTAAATALSWRFAMLLAATALAVGMVVGALLFGSPRRCPPSAPVHSAP